MKNPLRAAKQAAGLQIAQLKLGTRVLSLGPAAFVALNISRSMVNVDVLLQNRLSNAASRIRFRLRLSTFDFDFRMLDVRRSS